MAETAQAIGVREGALLILRQGDSTTEWPLAGETVIGRDETADVTLADRSVSRNHAVIEKTDQGYAIRDLDSKNGTWVNGVLVDGSVPLKDGDEVSVAARYKLFFVDAEATAPLIFVGRGLRVDPDAVMVYVNGTPLDPPLSGPQFELLRLLYDADGAVVTREEIIRHVWPEAHSDGVSEDAVDALVRRLRLRLSEGDPDQAHVVTVRGYGFRIEKT
jgi:pSer/pThr/pTyr-binding forkhead associated (FHA) protein